MCIWRNSSWEQDTFAPSLLHPLAVFELCIHLLGAYVIIFKTPATMGSVKRSMLMLHVCGAYLDILLSALSTQYMFVPVAAGYTSGLYTYLGVPVKWQEYLFFSTIALTGVALLGFFEGRYNAIVNGNGASFFSDPKRVLYIGFHTVFAVTFIMPVIFTPPDQEYGKQYLRDTLPCVPNEIIENPILYVFAIDITLTAWSIAVPITIFPSQCVFFAVLIAKFLSGTKAKSKRTHKLQVQFFIALCIQVSIPMTFLTVPVVYNVYAFAVGYYNQAINNISINIIFFHGLFSSIVMLTVHKPYRQAVYNMFFSRFFARCSRFTKPKSKSSNTSQVGPVDATFVIVSEYNTR